MRYRHIFAAAFAAIAGLAMPGTAQAEFPEKEITVIVNYGAGGATDLSTRTLARAMEKQLGVPVNVTTPIRAQNETLWADLAMIFEQSKRDRIIKDVPLDLFLPMLHGVLSALIRDHFHGTCKLTETDIELAVTTLWDAISRPQS